MKYAFIFVSIVAIWIAVILMTISVRNTASVTFLHEMAIGLTVVLFWIGFRSK